MLGAGLIYDDSRHYIDHLAPFCALLGWPLLVCEGAVAELARKFYPDLEVIETNLWKLKLPNNLVAAHPRLYLKESFPVDACNFFWLPHGNSDKGWQGASFEGLLQNETALVYGERMLEFMAAKEVFPKHFRIGNFRHHYYLKHKKFYDVFTEQYRGKKNILYAPTWDDSEKNNSFWKSFSEVASQVKSPYQLIVKLHPNTASKFAPEIEALMGRYPNVIFIEDFPPIYPLLEITDIYLGDMSSIGYDFLTMNRPMLFLNPNERDPKSDRGLSLFRCGREIKAEELGLFLEDPQTDLREERTKLYDETFDKVENWDFISEAIATKSF